ncbi:VOC family protein [Priestia endophytica]|jgi:lactoylglutathione lyase|uniref:VOC family protein n=1 Tax=Priestia endophytica TaxID=135735 RepID=UPI002E1BFBC7|nr:VOC family protein [Priestia endophytica]
MIKNLYETHLKVKNLEESISFYKKLGLQLAFQIEERRRAFFFIGETKQMLGLQEVKEGQEVIRDHFAFSVEMKDLEDSLQWLREKEIEIPKDFFGKAPIEPIVHMWMPAASVYFIDPNGHSLEFLTLLSDEPVYKEDIVYLSEWRTCYKSKGKQEKS